MWHPISYRSTLHANNTDAQRRFTAMLGVSIGPMVKVRVAILSFGSHRNVSDRVAVTWASFVRPSTANAVEGAQAVLSKLESCEREIESIDDPRDVLHSAAASLCRSREAQTSIITHIVNIPFRKFTKESIKLGVSLWLGVMQENPLTESRILVDVAHAWERTIDIGLGIFDPDFK